MLTVQSSENWSAENMKKKREREKLNKKNMLSTQINTAGLEMVAIDECVDKYWF